MNNNKDNKVSTLRMILFFVIIQLYFPLSDLWKIRNVYHNHKTFKDIMSDKYTEKFKKRLIQNETKYILKSLEKLPISLKSISEKELESKFKERTDLYHFMKGLLYFVGIKYNPNIHRDLTLSYESFKKAKEVTKAPKILDVANIQMNGMLMYGIGVNANAKQAFQNSIHYDSNISELQQANQDLLGHAYLFGKGTERNATKAYKHLKNAGKQAYSLLAYMYSSGIGVEKDMDKALELIKGTENSDLTAAILYLSDDQYTKGKYYLKKCMPTNQKCQKLYHSIFKYDFYDKVLNVISFI